uniref:FHA domain-containing protein n=1 Tax=Otolemur garnettii TaxID=30611 RepID=H0XQM0_OTOGA
GLHLDVVKGGKLIEKLIINENYYYLLGRNPDLCDFTIDRQSCSQVHVSHKHLKRVFLIDLSSTHNTFLGHIQLEPHKLQHIPIDSTISFGASMRYILYEKPQTLPSAMEGDEKMGGEDDELKGLLRLPEAESKLNNLTEFNTAHNKISALPLEERNLDKGSSLMFCENEITNPEDVDPLVGRFRDIVQTVGVLVKNKQVDGSGSLGLEESENRGMQNFTFSEGLYGGLPPTHTVGGMASMGQSAHAIPKPHPQVVDLTPIVPSAANMNPAVCTLEAVNEPKKKKYAKE